MQDTCKRTVRMAVKCVVCKQTIVEGKEQALYCEGVCKQWFHHYCAGIPSSWFAVLSTSTALFQCHVCYQHNHAKELADLSDIVSTLKKEVSVLRNDINCMKAASLSCSFAGVEAVKNLGGSNVGVDARGVAGARQGNVGRGGMWRGGRRHGGVWERGSVSRS